MAKNRQIKVGVVGYGAAYGMGRHHLRLLAANSDYTPWAACDIIEERLEAARQEFPGIETYADIGEMLRKSEVELVIIVLPHNLHAQAAIQCLKAGRHVVVEKPFAITVAECDRMIAAARKSGVTLSAFHNRHWDGNIVTIMKHLKKIGRPVRWESQHGGWAAPRDWWRADKEVSGGVVYDWGAHYTEWMLQVMNDQMTEISGFAVNEVWPQCTNEDELTYVVRFKAGGVGAHTETSIDMGSKPAIRIVGTKGAIVASGPTVEIHQVRANRSRTVTSHPAPDRAGHAYYANVANHILRGETLVITAEWARRVIQVLDYACRSAQAGRAMKPKYA